MELTIVIIVALAAVVAAALFYGRWTAARREVELLRQQLDSTDRFSSVADEALRRNSAELLQQNSAGLNALLQQNSAGLTAMLQQNSAGLTAMLQPLRDNLSRFEQSINDSYSREARERFSLAERVRELADLNRNIGEETRRLTHALKGNNKLQGDWGEMVLEGLLTRAGLTRDRDFVLQESITDSEGHRLRPDAVVKLPDDRCIVIDSKVSMTAYFDMLNSDSPEQLADASKALLTSVRSHVNELKTKKYQDYTGTQRLDFVLMFIPHEGAYLAAIDADPKLCESAFDSRVLIVSPTHLLAVLSIVGQLWRQDSQDRNALEIATQAGRLLDKLSGFVADMEKVGRAMTTARDAYDSAMSKLSQGQGNLLSRADKLRALGAKSRPIRD